jgi:TRAP-type mannitol/chloroaromatic compound transport system substrate-binding protein
MKVSRLLGYSVAFAAAVGLAITVSSPAEAQKNVRIKMHSAWPSSMVILGESGKRVAEHVTALSQKSLTLKHHEPGALVPAYEYFDSVQSGATPAAFGSPGINVGKLPPLAFFAAVPFGPRPGEYIAWVNHGGGKELLDEIYGGLGLYAVYPCAVLAPETAGWFKFEIKSLDQLSGMKIRFFGYGGKVLSKFGVSPQLLAGGDIYPALERGVIDAAEFSMPVMDEHFGFYEIAKHYYFPGWHQPASLQSLEFHKPTYDGLSDYHKLVLKAACDANVMITLGESEAFQFPAIKRMQAKGVNVHRWSDDQLAKFRTTWDQVVREDAASDPVFKKVWDSYNKFREDYKLWGNLAYVD